MKTVKILGDFPQEIIAVDEVGRGPLSGPVVIGAVRILVQDLESYKKILKFLKLRKVGDSKSLTGEERASILTKLGLPVGNYREKTRIVLKDTIVDYVTWEMDHEVIDQENNRKDFEDIIKKLRSLWYAIQNPMKLDLDRQQI